MQEKPIVRKYSVSGWVCVGDGISGYGWTVFEAYKWWRISKVMKNLLGGKLRHDNNE